MDSPDALIRPLPIIHINGYPGTGKLTIARHLKELLQKTTGDKLLARLIHNHLLIDPADAILHRTEPGYQALRKALRQAAFAPLEQNAATHNYIYIFTDYQSSDAVGSTVCAEYAAVAAKRNCTLVPVVLHCEEAENLRRLTSSERLDSDTGKLTDVGLVQYFRRNGAPVHRFEGDSAFLELDVTELAAGEAAERILSHVLMVCPEL